MLTEEHLPRPGSELVEPDFDLAELGSEPTHGRATRWWLAAAFALALAAFVPEAFGRQVFDTKIDLTVDPYSFLHHLLYIWDPNAWFGSVRNQIQGYAFPSAPFFIVGHTLAIPAWLVQRVWMAIVVTVAFWGFVRLAEELDIGSLESRLAGGAIFALWPTFTILVASNSVAAAPGALTAWVTIPLVRASRSGAPIRGAALSAVAVLFMSGTNAADTFYALLIPALFLITRAPSARKRSLIGWWVVCVGLATAWWIFPLFFLGAYGFNFLPFVEQSVTTTSTSSATTALDGTNIWLAYLNLDKLAWEQGAITIVSLPITIIGAALVAATGLWGLASREIRERRFLVVSLALFAVGSMVAYWGPLGGPWSQPILRLMNGPLAPLRSVHKLGPSIALVSALGIAHALSKLFQWKPRHVTRTTWQFMAGCITVAMVLSLATPYLMGRATNKYSFTAIPSYWYKVADFLARESPRNTALVLPGSSHGNYVWGWSVDNPLEALASSPWTTDENVPFGGPGSTRMIDAIELDLSTGTANPGLPALLRRSGIKYIVVQNDIQWQLSDSPSPLEVHRVLNDSGFTPVAQFGPAIRTPTTDVPTLQLNGNGPSVSYPAVQIYQASSLGGNNGANAPVATYPVSSAALVSGGPEAIEQLLQQGVLGESQAAILAGNWHGRYHGPLFAVTDTLRRQDTNFGFVNDNTSYTYTATGETPDLAGLPNTPSPPAQLLPFTGVQHQTVAVLKGAKSITASSTSSIFLSLPEYNPTNVFDGESSSGWITGSPNGAVGEWIQIDFDHPVNPKGTRVKFISGSGQAIPTRVRVSTDRGAVLTNVSTSNRGQLVNVPTGTARYLRVTFVSVKGSTTEQAGIRSISIPGVHVQSLLKPPEESAGSNARQFVFSFKAQPYDVNDLLRVGSEPVMERVFSTPRGISTYITGQALPRPGSALNALLGTSKLTITASSTLGNLPAFRPQNLIDDSKNTAWIANSTAASIHMRWPTVQKLSSLSLIGQQVGNFTTSPIKEVLISSPAGSRLLHVATSSNHATLHFAPLKTNSVTISFPKVQVRLVRGVLGGVVTAPVGLAELDFPALAKYRVVPPNPASSFSVPCGFGPPLDLDGTTYQTSLGKDPSRPATIGDLLALKPLSLAICPLKPVTLNSGPHDLVAPAGPMPFNVSALTIKELGVPTVRHAVARQARVLSWGPESRTLTMTSGPGTYLEVHQNYNVGWTATLNGKSLTPVRLDGWQQGYLVPAGRGGTVQLTFGPERLYALGMGLGALGVILLLLIAFGVLGKRRGVDLEPSLPWSKRVPLWLSIGLSAVVIFAIGGPLVLAVPVLVLIGTRRPAWLPWVALVSMTAAGVIAAIHPGSGALSQTGAFSAPAQACAVIALLAVLVPVVGWRSSGREQRESSHQSGEPNDALVGLPDDTREYEPAGGRNGDHADGGTS